MINWLQAALKSDMQCCITIHMHLIFLALYDNCKHWNLKLFHYLLIRPQKSEFLANLRTSKHLIHNIYQIGTNSLFSSIWTSVIACQWNLHVNFIYNSLSVLDYLFYNSFHSMWWWDSLIGMPHVFVLLYPPQVIDITWEEWELGRETEILGESLLHCPPKIPHDLTQGASHYTFVMAGLQRNVNSSCTFCVKTGIAWE
jgi:hypothetical protein